MKAYLIRVYNLPDNDRGRTDHQAVAIVKPTGTAEEQMMAYLCADPALGTMTIFKLECGAIAPLRDGTMGRAIAPRLPFFHSRRPGGDGRSFCWHCSAERRARKRWRSSISPFYRKVFAKWYSRLFSSL